MPMDLFQSSALPVLEKLAQFTQHRHKVLVNNIANLSTPHYKPQDLDPRSFQAQLRDAIAQRRASADRTGSPLPLRDSNQVKFRDGQMETTPQTSNRGLLYRDSSSHDLERTMQRLAENTMAHNAVIELIRREFRTLETAIRERV